MCQIEIDEHCDVWSEAIVLARKPHRCSCCFSMIQSGQNYLRHFSALDGDVSPGTLCMDCKTDRDLFAEKHDGILAHPSGLLGMVEECVYEGDDGDEDSWRPMLSRIKIRRVRATKKEASNECHPKV